MDLRINGNLNAVNLQNKPKTAAFGALNATDVARIDNFIKEGFKPGGIEDTLRLSGVMGKITSKHDAQSFFVATQNLLGGLTKTNQYRRLEELQQGVKSRFAH